VARLHCNIELEEDKAQITRSELVPYLSPPESNPDHGKPFVKYAADGTLTSPDGEAKALSAVTGGEQIRSEPDGHLGRYQAEGGL